MSFTSNVKSELLTNKADNCCNLAELSALLKIHGDVHLSSDGLSVEFNTTNLKIVRKVITFIKELYRIDVDIMSKKQMKLKKNDLYIVTIRNKASQIINELGLMNNSDDIMNDPNLLKECCKRAYLRGAFLASGSINSPKSSSYHLEISTSTEQDAINIRDLLNFFLLNAKYIKRKRGYIAYIKEAEKIADFLRVVSAIGGLLNFEDERIQRDFVNSITRVMNMEIANQNKTLGAANKQLRSISVLENMLDMNKLSKSMKEAIELRKENPEASLQELSEISGEMFNKIISKSALNHRFRNINDLADQIMENLNE
jgi:DNA-binding protein WhiA